MGDIAPSDIKELGINGIDYYKKVLSKNPEWISQAKQNNVLTNVWTVNSDDKIKYFVDKNIDFITTDEPLKALEIIRSAK